MIEISEICTEANATVEGALAKTNTMLIWTVLGAASLPRLEGSLMGWVAVPMSEASGRMVALE